MGVQANIEAKLKSGLAPSHVQVVDESHMHNVPAGAQSHFKVVVVSDRFDGVPMVQRHRRVNGMLEQEFRGGLHALSLQTMTSAEWARRGGETMDSPPCRGGGKTAP